MAAKGHPRAALAALAFVASCFVAPAFAQDETEEEAIVVTGSRIRTDPLTNRQPVTQLGQEDIERTGLSATADVLQRLPVSGGGLNTRNNNSGNLGNPPDGGGVGAGAAEIDLRFLGSRRVLVLVDGQRWVLGTSASGIPGSVDLNTIPTQMIERIEVLQESASPIYGSDAIAGVVNIITREQQDGLDAYAQYGGYFEEGDGETQDYGLSYGFTPWQGADVIIGANYQEQELVMSSDRELSAFPAPYATSCAAGGCSIGIVNGFFDITDPNTNQRWDSLVVGAVGTVPALYDPLDPTTQDANNTFRSFAGAADRFNFAPFNYLLTPSERLGAFATWSQEMTNTLEFRVSLTYANRKSANQAAPLPLFLGQDAGNGTILDDTIVDANQAFNPFGFELNPTTYNLITRRMIEAGPRHFEQEVETWDGRFTLAGESPLFNRTWYWDANIAVAQNTADQSFTGNINVANVQQALGAPGGCVAPCVPLNLWGGPGTITPEMIEWIGYTEHNNSQADLADFTFNVTGDLMQLPAGPLAVAAGYEYRYIAGDFNPDPLTDAGLTSDIPARSGSGSYDVNEIYAELRIPILADQPFFYLLEASVAGRMFDYSTFGKDETFSAGLRWRPIEELLFRGSWGQGFRAPSVGELFGGGSRFDATILDPCSDFNAVFGTANGTLGRDTPQPQAIIDNCVANGVPADGSYLQRNPQLPVFVRGTDTLGPETSESYNIGIVWRPRWFENQAWSDGVTFEVNYANISLESAIQAADPNTLMTLCAELGQCSAITRSPTGAVRAIDDPLTNAGFIDTSAIDFTISWQSPDWSFGSFGVTSFTSHLLEFVDGATNPAVDRAGTERGSPSQGYPEWKSQTRIDWDLGDWGASLTNRYVSSITETANDPVTELDSASYWDAQVRWTPANIVDGRMTFTLGMNNLFDEDTPGCFTCDVNNMDPSIHDIPGRFAYARIAYRH
ncbi:MAG TPA: TonB-dependent receptor [Vitreimonas sp.]|nr:TonB-dependent receptor [Vitreimonas sp.]